MVAIKPLVAVAAVPVIAGMDHEATSYTLRGTEAAGADVQHPTEHRELFWGAVARAVMGSSSKTRAVRAMSLTKDLTGDTPQTPPASNNNDDDDSGSSGGGGGGCTIM